MASVEVDVELGDVDIIQTTVQSLLDCVGDKNKLPKKLPPSIYMAPSLFREQRPSCFNPRVVSIGPLHSEDRKLKAFEVYKASTVHKLVHRFVTYPADQTFTLCVQKVIGSIGKIRDCYAEMKKPYTDVELAKMMVMDGCFVLAFIYNYRNYKAVVTNKLLQDRLIYDLLLLENQIPFFVLDDIFHVFLKFGFQGPLSNFMLPVLNHLHLLDENIDIEKIGKYTTHHILGLLHQCHMRSRDNIYTLFSFFSSSNYSAADLDRAGVRFKPSKYSKWSLAMQVEFQRNPCLSLFWSKPTLRMPVLLIHHNTELIFRNLMAYEHSLGCTLVTSYVAAMDILINTEQDISMLVESKVLKNMMGSNHEAADMMNRVCKGIAYTNFFHNRQWERLDRYYNGYWPKHVARFKRTYCGSPWNTIALVAGIVLFGLTVVQTICSIAEVGR